MRVSGVRHTELALLPREVEFEGFGVERVTVSPRRSALVVNEHNGVDVDLLVVILHSTNEIHCILDAAIDGKIFVVGEGALMLSVPEDHDPCPGLDRVLTRDSILSELGISVLSLLSLHLEHVVAPRTRCDPVHTLRNRLRQEDSEVLRSTTAIDLCGHVVLDTEETQEPGVLFHELPELIQAHIAPPAV